MLPALCEVCVRATPCAQLVPDRAPDGWRVDALCPLCFDGFLSLFPIVPERLLAREVTGELRPSRRSTATRR